MTKPKSNTSARSGTISNPGKGFAKPKRTSSIEKLSKNQTKRYTLIGVAVVLVSILYRKNAQQSAIDRSLQSFLQLSCENGMCMKDLVGAVDRTLFAGRRLEQGWKLFEIPRSMQIWTLDALRDPFIKNNLFGARHLATHQPLASKAFLAAYVAVLLKSEPDEKQPDAARKLRELYLELLPTYEDFKTHHPVTADLRELNSKLGANTYAYFMVSRRKAEIESEYKAFCYVSHAFKNKVTFEDYVAARLIVQTREFHTGALDGSDASMQELELYSKHLSIDLNPGSSALVPIVDAMNAHHEKHNVHYKYVPESKKFYLYASKDIQAGAELLESYGDRAEYVSI
jgi:SET domain